VENSDFIILAICLTVAFGFGMGLGFTLYNEFKKDRKDKEDDTLDL
jgi:hypothetical protein